MLTVGACFRDATLKAFLQKMTVAPASSTPMDVASAAPHPCTADYHVESLVDCRLEDFSSHDRVRLADRLWECLLVDRLGVDIRAQTMEMLLRLFRLGRKTMRIVCRPR